MLGGKTEIKIFSNKAHVPFQLRSTKEVIIVKKPKKNMKHTSSNIAYSHSKKLTLHMKFAQTFSIWLTSVAFSKRKCKASLL